MNLALSLQYAAERNPEAEAVVDGEARFTYAELRDRAARLAGGLAGEGLARGERLVGRRRVANRWRPSRSSGRP